MNDASEFNLDRINEAIRRVNTLHADPVEKHLTRLRDICEAFTEMDDTDIKQIGRLAARTRHGISVDALKLAVGEIVCRGLVGYAEKVAEMRAEL